MNVVIQDCRAQLSELMLKPTPRVREPADEADSELTVRTLFDTEESSLLRYAFALVGRRAVAEDIVQEVFLQLHVRWEEIDSPRAWLYQSVRNRVYNYVRDHRREVLVGSDSQCEPSQLNQDSPEALMTRIDTTGKLRELIDELNETDRQLVKLKYFEHLKYREIADRTGLSVSNVGYRLHHILKELAGKLRPLGIDESS